MKKEKKLALAFLKGGKDARLSLVRPGSGRSRLGQSEASFYDDGE